MTNKTGENDFSAGKPDNEKLGNSANNNTGSKSNAAAKDNASKSDTASKSGETYGVSGYSEAIEELEGILLGLSQNDVDVDDLAEKVSRGLELIKFCQAKISNTEMQVKEFLDTMEIDLMK